MVTMHGNWQEEELLILLILISIVFIFASLTALVSILYLNNKTNDSAKKMQNGFSEININIKEKSVYIKQFKGQLDVRTSIYSLDDYIYMISLNPDSKKFREFLKLINNGSKIKLLKDKMNELDSNIPFIIQYPNDEKRISIAQLNLKEKDISENFIFQSNENYINEKLYDLNFLNQTISILDDKDIFIALKKEIKNIKTKGMTLISLKPKKNALFTSRDFLLNQMDLLKMKEILRNKDINSFISQDGKIYFISNTTRKTNYFSVQKQWENKIQNIFMTNRKYKYIDLDFSMFEISAINESNKDIKSLNIAIIKSILYFKSSFKEREKLTFSEKINIKASEIDDNSRTIISNLKNNKDIFKEINLSFKEKKVKQITELYLNFPKGMFEDTVRMSFRYKKEIIDETIEKANKIAKISNNKLYLVSFDFADINSVSSSIDKINKLDNLLISFINYDDKKIEHNWETSIKNIKMKNFELSLNIKNINKKDFDIINLIKPKYIIIPKEFSETSLVIPEKFIIKNSKNKIKILNLI